MTHWCTGATNPVKSRAALLLFMLNGTLRAVAATLLLWARGGSEPRARIRLPRLLLAPRSERLMRLGRHRR